MMVLEYISVNPNSRGGGSGMRAPSGVAPRFMDMSTSPTIQKGTLNMYPRWFGRPWGQHSLLIHSLIDPGV